MMATKAYACPGCRGKKKKKQQVRSAPPGLFRALLRWLPGFQVACCAQTILVYLPIRWATAATGITGSASRTALCQPTVGAYQVSGAVYAVLYSPGSVRHV